MRGISFLDDFVPSGAPIGTKGVKTVKVRLGDEWVDVYDAANKLEWLLSAPLVRTLSLLLGGVWCVVELASYLHNILVN